MWDCIRLLLSSKLPRRLVLLVTNVFGISPSLVWREMTLEEAQISDTNSLKQASKRDRDRRDKPRGIEGDRDGKFRAIEG